jgi:hypothetical protein
MIYAAPIAGTLILLLLTRDVLITVFHPEGHGGPVHRVLNRAVWGTFRLVGRRRDGTLRRKLVSLAGPLIGVLTPTTWMVLVVSGFALIYYPWITELLVLPDGEPGPAWAEAIVHSLDAASTLGSASGSAEHRALRGLAGLQALAGFATLSAAIAYIMAVYREVAAMQTLALEIHSRLADGETLGLDDERDRQELEQWLAHVARVLLNVRQAFAQYPILHYFRPHSDADALLLQLGRLLDLRESLAGEQPMLARRPALRTFDRAINVYLLALRDQLLSRDVTDRPDEVSADEAMALHRTVLDYFMLDQPGSRAVL